MYQPIEHVREHEQHVRQEPGAIAASYEHPLWRERHPVETAGVKTTFTHPIEQVSTPATAYRLDVPGYDAYVYFVTETGDIYQQGNWATAPTRIKPESSACAFLRRVIDADACSIAYNKKIARARNQFVQRIEAEDGEVLTRLRHHLAPCPPAQVLSPNDQAL